MERTGLLGRLADHLAQLICLALLLALGFGLWYMGASGRAALWSGIWKTTVWVTLVGALPWGARPFIRRLMEVGSNWAGAAAVAGLVVADVVIAALLITAWPSGFWSWVGSLAVLGVAGTYNYLVLEYLSEQSGP